MLCLVCFLVAFGISGDRNVAGLVSTGPPIEGVPVTIIVVSLLRVLSRPDDDVRVPRWPAALGTPDELLSWHGQHHVFVIHILVHGATFLASTLTFSQSAAQ